MTSECDNLDAYLADDLPAAAVARFAQHLERVRTVPRGRSRSNDGSTHF